MPYYADDSVTLHHGDCLDVLRELPGASVDAVVTDPPYGLGFMGKQWDQPGQFGSSRRIGNPGVHRRGPERRDDQIGDTGAMEAGRYDLSAAALANFQRWCAAWATECSRVLKPGGHLLAFGGSRTWHRLATGIEDAGFEIRDSIAWLYGSGFPKSRNLTGEWSGWGTALKPAFEPIVVGRKPLGGTVAQNVAQCGTGALNIDGCRIGVEERTNRAGGSSSLQRVSRVEQGYRKNVTTLVGEPSTVCGRWPTNVVLTESAAAELDRQSGTLTSGKMRAGAARSNRDGWAGPMPEATGAATYGDSGGASRFFPVFRYEAKAPGSERPEVAGVRHPTVKPLDLMRWLVRLVTPPGGVVLDPFAGSGTTGEAAVLEHMTAILVEREPDYLPLIVQRLSKPLAVGFDFEEVP